MTWEQLAMDILRTDDPEFAAAVLWNCTAYPLCDIDTTIRQLRLARAQMDAELNPFVEADRLQDEAMRQAMEAG